MTHSLNALIGANTTMLSAGEVGDSRNKRMGSFVIPLIISRFCE